jgi:methionyl-tRNA formyltransferase
MDYRKYVFVGNREYVLKEMIKKNLNIVAVWVMNNSFLHKRLQQDCFIQYVAITNKKHLLQEIEKTDFDLFISNGCKYVLPVSKLNKGVFINIHPSFLPDLKGANPVSGACLYGRSSGATCHEMDDGIDTGRIISRIEIPLTLDIDSAILYQLCFKAEAKVFNMAYERSFKVLYKQPSVENPIYYSMKAEDWIIDLNKGIDFILRQVKAFGYKSHGLFFGCNGQSFKFYRASEIINPFVFHLFEKKKDCTVLLAFEDSIVFKIDNRYIRFDGIVDGAGRITEGMSVENGWISQN